MKRFVKEYANYVLSGLSGCDPLYVEYRKYEIDKILKLCQRSLVSENEAVQLIGDFRNKRYYTICGNTLLDEKTADIVYRRKEQTK